MPTWQKPRHSSRGMAPVNLTGSRRHVSKTRRMRNTPSARAWTNWAQSSESSSWRPSARMRWTRPTESHTCPTPPAEPLNGAVAEADHAHAGGREGVHMDAPMVARAGDPEDAQESAPTDAREGAPTDAREGAPMDAHAPDGATAPREREISLKHVQRAVVQSGRPLVALEKLEALETSSAQLSIA